MALMENAGLLLHGDVWQRALARDLGRFHPDGPRDFVDDRLVRRWAAGQRDIPAWVFGAVEALLAEQQATLEQRANHMASLRRMIGDFRTV